MNPLRPRSLSKIHFDMELVFTWRAVVVAMAVMSFPLLVRGAHRL
jgi:ABC-type molybdate transport system permease subunit